MQAWCLCRDKEMKRTKMIRKAVMGMHALTVTYECPECKNKVDIELFQG